MRLVPDPDDVGLLVPAGTVLTSAMSRPLPGMVIYPLEEPVTIKERSLVWTEFDLDKQTARIVKVVPFPPEGKPHDSDLFHAEGH